MVLEIELQHAESVHTLVLTEIPEFVPYFQNCGRTDPIHQKSVINNHFHHRQLSLHKQPRKQRAGALMLSSSCLDGSITRVGPS